MVACGKTSECRFPYCGRGLILRAVEILPSIQISPFVSLQTRTFRYERFKVHLAYLVIELSSPEPIIVSFVSSSPPSLARLFDPLLLVLLAGPVNPHARIDSPSSRGLLIVTLSLKTFFLPPLTRLSSLRRHTNRRSWILKRPCNSNSFISAESLSLYRNFSLFSSVVNRLFALCLTFKLVISCHLNDSYGNSLSFIVPLDFSNDTITLTAGKASIIPFNALSTSYMSRITSCFLSRTCTSSSLLSPLTSATGYCPPRIASDSNRCSVRRTNRRRPPRPPTRKSSRLVAPMLCNTNWFRPTVYVS